MGGANHFPWGKYLPLPSKQCPGHEGAVMLHSHHHRSAMRPHLCPLEFPKANLNEGFMSVSCTLNTTLYQQNFTFCMKPLGEKERVSPW
jgi:hypothetical protein